MKAKSSKYEDVGYEQIEDIHYFCKIFNIIITIISIIGLWIISSQFYSGYNMSYGGNTFLYIIVYPGLLIGALVLFLKILDIFFAFIYDTKRTKDLLEHINENLNNAKKEEE